MQLNHLDSDTLASVGAVDRGLQRVVARDPRRGHRAPRDLRHRNRGWSWARDGLHSIRGGGHDTIESSVALVSLLPTVVCNGALHGSQPAAARTLLKAHEWGALEPLSRCQLDTLRNVTLGLGNEEIARKICRTKRAVEWHIRFLNQQLGVSGRERLAMIGRDAGLGCFTGCEWDALLKTRPARRPGIDPVDDVPLQPAAAA